MSKYYKIYLSVPWMFKMLFIEVIHHNVQGGQTIKLALLELKKSVLLVWLFSFDCYMQCDFVFVVWQVILIYVFETLLSRLKSFKTNFDPSDHLKWYVDQFVGIDCCVLIIFSGEDSGIIFKLHVIVAHFCNG